MRFEDSSLIVGYIKELLHSFNLPMVQVYTSSTHLYDGRVYIKDGEVVKYEDSKFKRIAYYDYNREIINLTKNLIVNSSEYDIYTHEYLGDYLRFINDYHKVNLMGLYNCFTGEKLGRVDYSLVLKNSVKNIFDPDLKEYEVYTNYSIKTSNNDFIYYSIPVKFNKTYTIAINCDKKYEIACILYNDVFITSTPDELIEQSYMCVNGSSFAKPIIYSTEIDVAEVLWKKEKDLKMILKLPKDTNSSIVILEGNFLPSANVIDGDLISEFIFNEEHFPNMYYGKNSLLAVDNKEIYPFSDRLIEYLLGNVISNLDDISGNIEWVQNTIYRDSNFLGHYGMWDDNIRNTIYSKTLEQDITKGNTPKYGNTIIIGDYALNSEGEIIPGEFVPRELEKKPKRFLDLYSDTMGYVDKDVESLLRLL